MVLNRRVEKCERWKRETTDEEIKFKVKETKILKIFTGFLKKDSKLKYKRNKQ